jgi:hypothetical protein
LVDQALAAFPDLADQPHGTSPVSLRRAISWSIVPRAQASGKHLGPEMMSIFEMHHDFGRRQPAVNKELQMTVKYPGSGPRIFADGVLS